MLTRVKEYFFVFNHEIKKPKTKLKSREFLATTVTQARPSVRNVLYLQSMPIGSPTICPTIETHAISITEPPGRFLLYFNLEILINSASYTDSSNNHFIAQTEHLY